MNIKFDPEIKKGTFPKLLHTGAARRTYTLGFPTLEGVAPVNRTFSLNKKEALEFADSLYQIANLIRESTTDQKFWKSKSQDNKDQSMEKIQRIRENLL